MDRRNIEPDARDPLTPPASDLTAEQELWQEFGRVVGFTIAAIVLLVGGGILLIALAAAFFNFIYGP